MDNLIAALRAKAASTTFPQEAEIFNKKADELEQRYLNDVVTVKLKTSNNLGLQHLMRLLLSDGELRSKKMGRYVFVSGPRYKVTQTQDTYNKGCKIFK